MFLSNLSNYKKTIAIGLTKKPLEMFSTWETLRLEEGKEDTIPENDFAIIYHR